jgi:general secretion pathway protein D
MKERVLLIMLGWMAATNVMGAEQFVLRDPGTGASYGPFDFRDGSVVQIGSRRLILRPVVPTNVNPSVATRNTKQGILSKMETIIIPEIDFRQANIRDVVLFLQSASREYDMSADPAAAKGVNIILQLQESNATSTVPLITFRVRHVSLLEALKITANVSGLKYSVQGNVVLLVPADYVGALLQRAYTLTHFGAGLVAEKTGGGNDEKVKQMLVGLGVAFPPGSGVTYFGSGRKLVVRNSAENLETFEAILTQFFNLADDEDVKEMSRRRQ